MAITAAQRQELLRRMLGAGSVDRILEKNEIFAALVAVAQGNSVGASGAGAGGLIYDFSVNQSKIFVDHLGHLILECDKKNTGAVAGNFNGGGSGNKPLAGIAGYEGTLFSDFPVIALEASLRTEETVDDADEDQLGVSFNAMIRDPAHDATYVAVITNTLNGRTDKYGEVGASASLTDFDISAFINGGTLATFANVFFIVGNAPNYMQLATAAGTGTGALFKVNAVGAGAVTAVDLVSGGLGYTATDVLTTTINAGEAGAGCTVTVDTVDGDGKILTFTVSAGGAAYVAPVVWTANPMSIEMLTAGGTMPITGSIFAAPGHPNIALVACPEGHCLSTDGGLPAGTTMTALWAQLGGSGNALRTVTAITEFTLDGAPVLPTV